MGPIPEGWLKSHRKSWYSRYLSLSDYSSRSVKFSASPYLSHHWQTTGLDGPSASATFGHSFPQPEDIDGEPDDEPDLSKSRQDGTENAGPEDVADELEAPSTAVEIGDGSPEAGSPRKEPPGRSKWRPTSKDRFDAGNSKDRPNNSCFGTAPMKQRKNSKSKLSPLLSAKSPPASSFVTAKEIQTPRKNIQEAVKTDSGGAPRSMNTAQLQPGGNPESPISAMSRQPNNGDPMSQQISASSTEALLPHGPSNAGNGRSPELQPGDSAPVFDGKAAQTPEATRDGMVRFNLDNAHRSDTPATVRFALPGRRRSWRHLRKESSHPGEIVKMEKMLVRVDSTVQELPADYDENEGFKIETRAVEKWREFVIVCRESTTEDADFSIQMYKTRVIPAKEQTHVQKRSAHEIPLARKKTHVNLYSSLDKTLVIWVPWKLGTMMYILRTHSAASAVEWYTFIRSTLGSHRTTSLQISVPDLSVTLQLENPFGELEASMSRAQAAKGDEEAISKTMEAERAVASTIIQRSLKMLENNPEWSNVLEAWLAKEKVGLAWKRYDRLEWIHGSNEQRMYGTLAMQRTHELELRPKEHYPTSIKQKDHKLIEEPAPVEGFLVRLTSQKGRVKRLGQMYFKRLYFATHNQFLCYCRPAKALPPSPPELRLSETAKVPKASDIVDQIPLIYAVNPYPEKEGEIEWLHQGTAASIARHDEGAYKEAERKINTILQAEGYINLSHILRVQNAQRGSSLADENVGYGPDVDFHEEVEDIRQEDGKTEQFDDNRTFELVMKNKLIIRLQAYNESAKKEWIHRLRKLINYWKLRLAADMDLLKAIRALNLKRLELDEESEAYIGQFGSKWEVTRSVASPKLFNMCGISCCRTITVCTVNC